MSRKLMLFVLTIALAFSTLSLRPTPTAAQNADSNTAFANLFPADTVVYGNIHTTDLQKTVDTFTALLDQLVGIKLTKPYQQVDASLTQFFGRDASVEKDILPWLGDNVAFGYILSDDDMKTLLSDPKSSNSPANQKGVVVIAVKDQAAGDAFLKELLAALNKQATGLLSSDGQQVTLNGDSVTLYAGATFEILQAKGYYAIGTTKGSRKW